MATTDSCQEIGIGEWREEHKTRIVNIDVWEYEGDSLRHQFFPDLQAQLREQKIISGNKDYVAEAYEGRTGELKPGFHSR